MIAKATIWGIHFFLLLKIEGRCLHAWPNFGGKCSPFVNASRAYISLLGFHDGDNLY